MSERRSFVSLIRLYFKVALISFPWALLYAWWASK